MNRLLVKLVLFCYWKSLSLVWTNPEAYNVTLRARSVL